MSLTFFTAPEWDEDVPKQHHEKSILKTKSKKKNKHEIDKNGNLPAIGNVNNQDKKSINKNSKMPKKNALKKMKRKHNKDQSKNEFIIEETMNDISKDLIADIQQKLQKGRDEIRKIKIAGKEKNPANITGDKVNILELASPVLLKRSKIMVDEDISTPKKPKLNQSVVARNEAGNSKIRDKTPIPTKTVKSKTEKNKRRRRKKNIANVENKEILKNEILQNMEETVSKISKTKLILPKNKQSEASPTHKSSNLDLSVNQNNDVKNLKKKHLKNKIADVLSLSEKSDYGIVSTSAKEVSKKKSELNENKSLRDRVLQRLKSARFRYLNEQMYTKASRDAQRIFNEDPTAFTAYHDGYRQQVNKWPLNPLDVIIKDISTLPKEYLIADLGCGDARLSKSVSQKVYSFDLISLNPNVQSCDMAHTPLLTSHVNIVVFCLSLMGTNLKDYIIEANRILKVGGLLKIAEVESRFENIEDFTKSVQKYGFKLVKSDLTQNLFYFMDFKKENDITKRNKLPHLTLKPCLYKKR